MRIIFSNVLLAFGLFTIIAGVLFRILHYSIGFLTGKYILYIGIVICGVALFLNIFFAKKHNKTKK